MLSQKNPSRQFYSEYSNLIMYSYNRGEIQHSLLGRIELDHKTEKSEILHFSAT